MNTYNVRLFDGVEVSMTFHNNDDAKKFVSRHSMNIVAMDPEEFGEVDPVLVKMVPLLVPEVDPVPEEESFLDYEYKLVRGEKRVKRGVIETPEQKAEREKREQEKLAGMNPEEQKVYREQLEREKVEREKQEKSERERLERERQEKLERDRELERERRLKPTQPIAEPPKAEPKESARK